MYVLSHLYYYFPLSGYPGVQPIYDFMTHNLYRLHIADDDYFTAFKRVFCVQSRTDGKTIMADYSDHSWKPFRKHGYGCTGSPATNITLKWCFSSWKTGATGWPRSHRSQKMPLNVPLLGHGLVSFGIPTKQLIVNGLKMVSLLFIAVRSAQWVKIMTTFG